MSVPHSVTSTESLERLKKVHSEFGVDAVRTGDFFVRLRNQGSPVPEVDPESDDDDTNLKDGPEHSFTPMSDQLSPFASFASASQQQGRPGSSPDVPGASREGYEVQCMREGSICAELPRLEEEESQFSGNEDSAEHDGIQPCNSDQIAPMRLLMLVVGTRGDVQPFIAIALRLQQYGHRIRLATHKTYRDWVESFGIEFYPLGGDPKVLSEYVVKNRGLIGTSIFNPAEIQEQSRQLEEIIESCWAACVDPDPAHPEIAWETDAIIANPPAFAHYHCAEKLQVRLHMVFTMPWTPTAEFPTPWVKIIGSKHKHTHSGSAFEHDESDLSELSDLSYDKLEISSDGSNLFKSSRFSSAKERTRAISDLGVRNANLMSYQVLDQVQWVAVRPLVQKLRKELGMEPVSNVRGAHVLNSKGLDGQKVPWTYIWSPALMPKPGDWGPHIDVTGFVFLPLKDLTHYQPSEQMAQFLTAEGPPIVFIGFGSLVIPSPRRMTSRIFKLARHESVRVVVQRGWAGLGEVDREGEEVPPNVLLIDNVPHDWLFPRVHCVVHHGGAGTTAAGLVSGKPTFIVPFFGDQPFWGAAVAAAGVGPPPVSITWLTSRVLRRSIKQMLTDSGMQQRATDLAEKLRLENGVQAAVDSIHKHLFARSTPEGGAALSNRGSVHSTERGLRSIDSTNSSTSTGSVLPEANCQARPHRSPIHYIQKGLSTVTGNIASLVHNTRSPLGIRHHSDVTAEASHAPTGSVQRLSAPPQQQWNR